MQSRLENPVLRTFVSFTIILSIINVVPALATYSEAVDENYGPITTIYDSLTENQKKGYDALDTAVKNHTSTGDLSYMSIKDGETVHDAYMYDHPEVFWFRQNFKLMIYPDTTANFTHEDNITKEQIATMQAELENSVKSLSVDAGAPDYKRLRAIHDWLCDEITYDLTAEHAHDLYGALVQKKCVCEGYALAFNYLCNMYGFKCVTVVGYVYSASEPHAWNLVYGEGNWYFVDVTWDDTERHGGRTTYFMVGSETKIQGRTFATEDHMADSLYGITPATEQFKDPERQFWGRVIIVAAAILLIAYIALKIRKRRKIRSMIEGTAYSPTEQGYPGRKCPYCGAILDEGTDFCASCGGLLKVTEEEKQE